MAVALKGEAAFGDGAASVAVVINVNVLLKAEQETGFGVFELVARAASTLGVMASILRHAIAEAGGQEMALPDAAQLLLLNDAAAPAVLTALAGALPKEGKGKANPPKAARKRGTGTTS